MFFSICVCTYNRAQVLPYCLESLTNLKVPAECGAEILVIDNNSVDNTKEVVSKYSERSKIPIFYFYESKQGLSAARNRAVKEASGDYIGFLDDECAVPANWLEIIFEDINEFAPLIIGGPYMGALLPGTHHKWFKVKYGNVEFVAYDWKRGYQKNFRARGGNIFLHRSVCERHQFDENFGMSGSKLKLGEEVMLQERFLSENAGTMVFYEPRIKVPHYILPHKMRLSYRARRVMEAGAHQYKLGSVALLAELARALTYLCLCPLRATFRDRSAYPYWQNYAYEIVIPRVMPVVGAGLEKLLRRYQ
jgi:glycosyltransferase involved in cell wall biosynthesis